MANDWTKPVTTDLYTNILSIIRGMFTSVLKMDFTGDTNIPSGAVRLNTSNSDKLEKFDGSSWNLAAFISTIDAHIANTALHTGVATGAVIPFAGASAPTGYLLCDGTAVSRTTYATLFALIGTTYGVGDGSTTFNMPDCRGRFPLGKAAAGTGSVLASTGGSLDHTHTGPSHTHTVAAHTHDLANHVHSSPSHSHTVPDHTHSVPAHYHWATANGGDIQISVASGAHNHNANGKEGGSNGSGANRAQGASSTSGTNVTWTNGVPTGNSDHTHPSTAFSGRVGKTAVANDGDIGFATAGSGVLTSNTTAPGNTGTPSVNTSGSTALTTDAAGTGATGTANPAYISLNYIIKT